ncbi:MAG: tetratricopeptide repeat protein [Gemmataceae bacterium]
MPSFRKWLIALSIVVSSSLAMAADAPAWKPPPGELGEARERLNKGNYAEARAKYESLLKDEKTKVPAAIGLARGWRFEGEYDKALEVLSKAIGETPDHPDLLAERADLRFDRGQWDEAKADAQAAMKRRDDHFLARWTLARLARDSGDLDEADRAMRWFVRTYSQRSNEDKDIVDPELLYYVAQAGAENARWHRLVKQFSFIVNEIVKDTLKSDKTYWQAEAFAGALLLEKYNRPDALESFDKALEINPKAADAMVGKANASLLRFEMKEADLFADEALKVNPRHLGALMVKTDVLLTAGDFPAAEKRLLAAKSVNPRDSVVLGKLAATYTLLGKPDLVTELIKTVETFDSKPAVFYTVFASALEDRKRYQQAKQYFIKAAALRPNLPAAQLSLGLLAMRLGEEADAKAILTKAFEADAFNVRARNSLEVLKHLDKYQTITTEHYILRYDEKTDRLLAGFVAEYLEELHADYKRQFGYEPPGKTIVQLFNSHEMFSGRVVGLPDLHTIGACTGPLFAMASPKAKGVRKPFNWGRVVRHELTHIFNLDQTEYQCPHWLTEGLAVRNEKMVRPPAWTKALRERYLAKELFTLENIMFGFVRPRGQDEWALAYCQSHLYVEYLVKTHGEEAIAKLLKAYQGGLETPAAIKQALGIDVAEFEKGYSKYIDEVVKPYLGSAKSSTSGPGEKEAGDDKPMTFAELEKAHEKDPKDNTIAARLAEQLLKRNRAGDARKIVDQILETAKGHSMASLVKARLLQRAGEDDAAREILNDAVKANPDDARLLFAAGMLLLDSKDNEKAASLFERGRKIAPLDADWLGALARLYTETKQTDELLDVLKEVVAGDPDELVGRMKLARAALEGKKFADAERFARESAQIDITNPEVQALYVEVLTAAGKTAEAEKLKKRFEESPAKSKAKEPAGEQP